MGRCLICLRQKVRRYKFLQILYNDRNMRALGNDKLTKVPIEDVRFTMNAFALYCFGITVNLLSSQIFFHMTHLSLISLHILTPDLILTVNVGNFALVLSTGHRHRQGATGATGPPKTKIILI